MGGRKRLPEHIKLRHQVKVSFNESEYKTLLEKQKQSDKPSPAEFIKSVYLKTPVVVSYRDTASDDLKQEIVELRNAVNAIGVNFNQLVKQINTAAKADKYLGTFLPEIKASEGRILKFMDRFETQIAKLYDKWFQE